MDERYREWSYAVDRDNPDYEFTATGIRHRLPPEEDYELPTHVEHPDHYTYGAKEAIEIMADLGVLEEYCVGNIIKYLYRYKRKGHPLEDIQKAARYIQILLEHLEEKEYE